jgi:hypothetical protein
MFSWSAGNECPLSVTLTQVRMGAANAVRAV